MAPRIMAKPAAAAGAGPAPQAAHPPRPGMTTPPPRPAAPMNAPGGARTAAVPPPMGGKPLQPASPQGSDALAEKLRVQRAAAEKLAEQRVVAAKERAEALRSGQHAQAPTSSPAKPVQPANPNRPKFTFAEEDLKREATAQGWPPAQARPPQRPAPQAPLSPNLAPPRPALGGERPLPPPARQLPPTTGYQPQYRPQPPQGYRPIDPATGYPPPPVRPYPQGVGSPDPRVQVPANYTPEIFRRPPHPQDDLGYTAPAGYEPPPARGRGEPLRAPVAPRDEDFGDDIFEEAPAPRAAPGKRASATDYSQAYRDNDNYYDEEPRPSRGIVPWILLLALMLLCAGGGYWYYMKNVKGVTGATNTNTAPVVAAPEQSTKVVPEPTPTTPATASGQAAPPTKKQIYDRIIGDKEVPGGQVVPTEEPPVQPAGTQGQAQPIPDVNGTQVAPAADPTAPAGQAAPPAPGTSEEPLPIPPPPGGNNGTQGALTPPASTTVAAAGAQPQPVAGMAETSSAAAPAATPAPATVAAAAPEQVTPPAAKAPAEETITTETPAPVKPKPAAKPAATQAAAKPKPKAAVALGAAPVVLVPPANGQATIAPEPLDNGQAGVVDQSLDPQQTVPVKRKKKTLFGLLNGTNDTVDQTDTVTTAPVAPAQQQVASAPVLKPLVQPAPQPQAPPPLQQASAGGNGYYAQLASFRTEAEARSEFARMKGKHPALISGYGPVITQADVGGSTRYRLTVGPMASRDQASSLCSSLLASGERDCLVSHQ